MNDRCKTSVFVDVNLIPMDSPRIIEKQIVIVEEDRITQMGPSDEVIIPDNSLIIVAYDKYLMPGLSAYMDWIMRIMTGLDAKRATRPETGNPFIFPGLPIHKKLEALVNTGLTPFEAYKKTMQTSGEIADTHEAVGAITLGSRANLVLLNNNPLEDIKHIAHMAGIMVNGVYCSAMQIREMMQGVIKY
jgi:imidazolonepropionase-like amidohydrolase